MTLLTNLGVNKNMKGKENFTGNQFNNTLRLFDVLPNFRLGISKTMCNYY